MRTVIASFTEPRMYFFDPYIAKETRKTGLQQPIEYGEVSLIKE